MNVDTGEFRALTAEVERLREQLLDLGQAVADMGDEMAILRSDASVLRSLEEAWLHRIGVTPGPGTRLLHHRPRHLRAVDGGAS